MRERFKQLATAAEFEPEFERQLKERPKQRYASRIPRPELVAAKRVIAARCARRAVPGKWVLRAIVEEVLCDGQIWQRLTCGHLVRGGGVYAGKGGAPPVQAERRRCWRCATGGQLDLLPRKRPVLQ